MESLLLTLAVLACPAAMGVMMWMMMRGRSGGTAGPPRAEEQVAELRSEVERLKAERAEAAGNAR